MPMIVSPTQMLEHAPCIASNLIRDDVHSTSLTSIALYTPPFYSIVSQYVW